MVEETYNATADVDGPLGVESVDARPSDALNLAVLVQAPILAAPGVLQEAEARRAAATIASWGRVWCDLSLDVAGLEVAGG